MSNYSKKHYNELAEILRFHTNAAEIDEKYGGTSKERIRMIVLDLTTLFLEDNPNFNAQRFQDAITKP